MDEPSKFVSIGYFMKTMLGFKSDVSYYNHLDDEGWPQRVWPTASGKPMLVRAECDAYLAGKMENRVPPKKVFVKARAGKGVRAPRPDE